MNQFIHLSFQACGSQCRTYPKIRTANTSLKDFLVHLAKDPTYKINKAVQTSIAAAIINGGDYKKIDFRKILLRKDFMPPPFAK